MMEGCLDVFTGTGEWSDV